VVCTHLHVDHVGWNTTLKNGKWVPTFANARYLIGGTEWDFFSTFDGKDMRDPVEDSVRPVVEAGVADLVESNFRITERSLARAVARAHAGTSQRADFVERGRTRSSPAT